MTVDCEPPAEGGPMHGIRLDHVTIKTIHMDATVAFYTTYLGLQPGFRPNFSRPGAWLYPHDSDYPIVHLVCTEDSEQPGGNFDHIAFRGVGLAAYVAKLQLHGEPFALAAIQDTPLAQVQHHDPNGVKIEVTFEEPIPTDLTHLRIA